MKKQIFIIVIQFIFLIHTYGQNTNQNSIKTNKTDKNSESCLFKSLPDPAGIIIGEDSVCQGASNVIYSVPAISGATSYFWTLPNGFTGVSNTNSITLNIDSNAISGYISVKGHNIDGDGTPSSIFINVLPKPNIIYNISPFPYSGCAPLTLFFNNLTLNTQLSIWLFGDGATSIFQNSQYTYDSQGQYDIELYCKNIQGCVSSILLNDFVTVYPIPFADFLPNKFLASIQEPIIFTNMSTNATFYKWYFGDGTTSNLENPIHSYQSNGDYVVTLVVESSYGCKDSTTKIMKIFPSGLNEHKCNNLIILQNQIKDYLIIELKQNNDYKIEVFNMLGKKVYNSIIYDNQTIINTLNWQSGFYIIKVHTERETIVKKILKQ